MADDATPNQRPADPIVNGIGYQGSDLLSRIGEWDRLLDAHWNGWRQEALQCYDFVAGRKWTRLEIDEMQALSRITIVFNRIAPTIDEVSGAEIGNRQQVQYFPRQVGDTAIDDILTQGAEWIMDECEGTEEDSSAFRDALICGIGVTETRPRLRQGFAHHQGARRPARGELGPVEPQGVLCRRALPAPQAPNVARQLPRDVPRLGDGGRPRSLSSRHASVIVDPRIRYDGTNDTSGIREDEVIVREYQWYDNEPRHLVGGVHAAMIRAQYPNVPTQSGYVKLTPDQHAELKTRYPEAQTAQIKEKVYYRCFAAGNQTEHEVLELEDFTYTAMTGKRDRNKNYWYGLVRPMMDPQKWANKLYSQLMHIFRSNANGGVVMEEGAALDQKEFEKELRRPVLDHHASSPGRSSPARTASSSR